MVPPVIEFLTLDRARLCLGVFKILVLGPSRARPHQPTRFQVLSAPGLSEICLFGERCRYEFVDVDAFVRCLRESFKVDPGNGVAEFKPTEFNRQLEKVVGARRTKGKQISSGFEHPQDLAPK